MSATIEDCHVLPGGWSLPEHVPQEQEPEPLLEQEPQPLAAEQEPEPREPFEDWITSLVNRLGNELDTQPNPIFNSLAEKHDLKYTPKLPEAEVEVEAASVEAGPPAPDQSEKRLANLGGLVSQFLTARFQQTVERYVDNEPLNELHPRPKTFAEKAARVSHYFRAMFSKTVRASEAYTRELPQLPPKQTIDITGYSGKQSIYLQAPSSETSQSFTIPPNVLNAVVAPHDNSDQYPAIPAQQRSRQKKPQTLVDIRPVVPAEVYYNTIGSENVAVPDGYEPGLCGGVGSELIASSELGVTPDMTRYTGRCAMAGELRHAPQEEPAELTQVVR